MLEETKLVGSGEIHYRPPSHPPLHHTQVQNLHNQPPQNQVRHDIVDDFV